MMLSRRRFMTISAGTAAALLLPPAVRAREMTRWSGFAMGADASIAISGLAPADAASLITMARREVERLEQIFSLYRAGSALSQLNGNGRLPLPPADLLQVLSLSATIHEATEGAFDPTVQPLWRLMAETGGQPTPAQKDAALSLVGFSGVRVQDAHISFAKKGMALTLNGIAQGYASDRVAALLKAQGLENVLVDMGEIVAVGESAPETPWRIGIAERGDGDVEEEIALTDMAIATSAPRGTLLDAQGTVSHILDPRGRAGASAWRRISVIHSSAAVADGLSTGFALMNRAQIDKAVAAFAGARVIAAAA